MKAPPATPAAGANIAAAASPALPASTDGFVRVEGGKTDAQADLVATVVAYSFIAAVWLVFVGLMWRRVKPSAERLERLELALKRKAQGLFVE